MNANEFNEMRAKKDIPHDHEICWDAHDRHGSGYSDMSGPEWWFYLGIPLAILACWAFAAYYTSVMPAPRTCDQAA